MNFQMRYYEGHPAGWTDDLGIIADKNQWIEGQDPGWYCNFYTVFSPGIPRINEMYKWCTANLQNRWEMLGAGFYFADEKDAMLFMLKWS